MTRTAEQILCCPGGCQKRIAGEDDQRIVCNSKKFIPYVRRLHAAGYAVVPVKPTEAMNIAGREARRGMGANVDVYLAMVAAAQEETT